MSQKFYLANSISFASKTKLFLSISIFINLVFVGAYFLQYFQENKSYIYDACLVGGSSVDSCRATVRMVARQEKIERRIEEITKHATRMKLRNDEARYEKLKADGYSESDLKLWVESVEKRLLDAGYSQNQVNRYFYGNQMKN